MRCFLIFDKKEQTWNFAVLVEDRIERIIYWPVLVDLVDWMI